MNQNTPLPGAEDEPPWPGAAWEKRLLSRTSHLSLPRILDSFTEAGVDYLIEELPEGRPFWDAWEELPLSWPNRCAWLRQVAEALEQLHRAGAILDGLRPDIVVVTPTGQAVIGDLTGLLPLPVPPGATTSGSLYSAPELAYGDGRGDARADLYGFGATIHALLLGRELIERDFEAPGVPRPYAECFPDTHPLLGRLLARTFVRHPDARFPSRGGQQHDPSGFLELVEVLGSCRLNLAGIRLDAAAWTDAGVVRAANEDAVAVLAGAEARLDGSDDIALVVLADGMGGMASGEVAAAMTVQTVREYFLRHPPFESWNDSSAPECGRAVSSARKREHTSAVLEALREANRLVYEAAKSEAGHAGMGCTAEVVLIDGRHATIGHVGDSRTYLIRHGRLTQITHDQTLVSHLVLLGQLTQEEADAHPQRAELQQAVGGRRDVYPDTYSVTLEAGDWLLVCSDGLSSLLRPQEIVGVVQTAGSAEKAARRLVNRAIVRGAFDNVSVAVVRAC